MEKVFKKEYAKNMLGFSKKRFFITLGLSVVIWLGSGILQLLIQQDQTFGFFSFGGSCEITGYPVALCISSNDNVKFILISLINMVFWFWVIHLFWNWFEKRGK